MRSFLATLVILLGVAAAAVYQSAFIVHQNEQVLVLRFGEPKRVVKTPGLNWKVPILDTVDYFDKRILDLDSQAAGGHRLRPQAPRRRCLCPLPHHGPAAVLSRPYVTSATSALASRPLVEASLRRVLGGATFQDLVRDTPRRADG